MAIIIPTCETAVSTVPEWHRADFKGSEEKLSSTAGWSPGALNLAQGIAMKLHAPLIHADMTRLLIDLTKHPDDDARWSSFSKAVTPEQRRKLDERQKQGYLSAISQRVNAGLNRDQTVVHLSVDTARNMGDTLIRFIYDSSRISETDWVKAWSAAIRQQLPEAVIQEESSPTRSLAGHLRSLFPSPFCSIGILVNQDCFLEGKPIRWDKFKKLLLATIPT